MLRSLLERAGLVAGAGGHGVYHAFISYSHAADGQLAPALQKGIQRLGKGVFERRALRVFRDETDLSLSSSLPGAIERALAQSDWLLVLVSASSVSSVWVNREVEIWRATRGTDHLHERDDHDVAISQDPQIARFAVGQARPFRRRL